MDTVAGHGLEREGAAFGYNGERLYWNTVAGHGIGRCSCGATSPWLDTAAARRRWHKDHKLEVIGRAHD